jgi:ubiquinone/menaquinone biosynthesis C-methylase UbiE
LSCACARAERIGCQVVGIDLSPRMVVWAKQRAKSEHVTNRVEFRVADAQKLPFEDARFDAVIPESVLSFVPGKSKALREFIRVTKSGGYVALNESCWLSMASLLAGRRNARRGKMLSSKILTNTRQTLDTD